MRLSAHFAPLSDALILDESLFRAAKRPTASDLEVCRTRSLPHQFVILSAAFFSGAEGPAVAFRCIQDFQGPYAVWNGKHNY